MPAATNGRDWNRVGAKVKGKRSPTRDRAVSEIDRTYHGRRDPVDRPLPPIRPVPLLGPREPLAPVSCLTCRLEVEVAAGRTNIQRHGGYPGCPGSRQPPPSPTEHEEHRPVDVSRTTTYRLTGTDMSVTELVNLAAEVESINHPDDRVRFAVDSDRPGEVGGQTITVTPRRTGGIRTRRTPSPGGYADPIRPVPDGTPADVGRGVGGGHGFATRRPIADNPQA